jgi:hypothetical protein
MQQVVLHSGNCTVDEDGHPNFAKLYGINWPHCEKCNKPVDEVEVENCLDYTSNGFYLVPHYTGERILTIRCHGEKWKYSNWRGALHEHENVR